MDKLLEELRWMLNLAVTATQDEVVQELQKAIDQIKAADPAATSAADFSIAALVQNQGQQIAALTTAAANPDPSKYVPVSTMKTLQDQVAALTAVNIERDVNDIVVAALANGKLLPAQEAWAREHGKQNLASLKQYIETAQPVAALTGTQTGGTPPNGNNSGNGGSGNGTSTLSDQQIAICTSMGVSPEDYAKTLQVEAQAQA